MERERRAKEIVKRFRRMKVQRHWRQLSTYWQYYPELRIKGAWLELAGFEVGDEVEIEVKANQLIITNKSVITNEAYDNRTNQKPTKHYPSAESLWPELK